MQQNLSIINCQSLRHLCMSVFHNVGIFILNGHIGFANAADTLTQYTDIAGQLAADFHYFDIHLIIHGDQFYTDYYSDLEEL